MFPFTNPSSIMHFMKLLTQITLLLKLRRAARLNRTNTILQRLFRSNSMVLPSIMQLVSLLYKLVMMPRRSKLLTKPHSLIGLLNRYRFVFFSLMPLKYSGYLQILLKCTESDHDWGNDMRRKCETAKLIIS